jgi:RNA polymerase sigma-70 factor (ECF subfamily)
MTSPTLNEHELLAALRRGDEEAFRKLVRSYHAPLRRLALGYVRSTAVADEVVQETWVGVIHGIRTFEGRSSLRTWIFRILANTAKTRAVREGRSIPFSALQDPSRVPEAAVDADRFLPEDHERHPSGWATPPRALPGRKQAVK